MRKLASIAVAFAGLLALTLATSLFSFALFNVEAIQAGNPGSIAQFVLGLIPSALAALLGMYLIYNRQYLPGRWFADEDVPGIIQPAALLRVGLILVGVSMALNAATAIVSSVGFYIPEAGQIDSASGWLIANLVGPLLRLIFGLILVLRSEPLSDRLIGGRASGEKDGAEQ